MKLQDFLSEEQILSLPMMEMSNLAPGTTGLPTVIWIGKIGGQHGPRIKVSNIKGKFAENDNFVVSISKNPQVLTPKYVKLKTTDVENIKDWIVINFDVLMELFDHFESGDGDTLEYLNRLMRI